MTQFSDTDFLYIDPEKRTVVGPVQWSRVGSAKPLLKPEEPQAEDSRRRWSRRKEYYPWGSYRSLKRLYHLEGKEKEEERTQTLDQALERSLKEAYWEIPAPAANIAPDIQEPTQP